MASSNSGGQGLAPDEHSAGSRFSDVKRAVFANRYEELPHHRATLTSLLRGLFSLGHRWEFLSGAARTLDSRAALRWQAAQDGWTRLLHPNGICLTGVWSITEPTEYTGFFRQHSTGLVVGRYSTCCTKTLRGQTRSLSLVGKVFPTMDPDELVEPADFITQEDIGGRRTRYINDAELRNAPDTTPWRRGLGLPILLVTGLVFNKVDRQPTHRQLYPLAELGKDEDTPTRAPEFMRLLVSPGQPRVEGERLDFRDEILYQIYDRPGGQRHGGKLVFDVEVSDEGETHGPPIYQRRSIRNWRRIGHIAFDDAVASFNGDCVLHFHHPAWRRQRNDPLSTVRVDGRRRG